jgi:hypothetical protein
MLKRFGLILSSGLLKITLFSLALAGAGWMTFGTPDNLKKAADESKLYDSAVTNVLDAAKQDAQSQTDTQLPLDDPKLEQVAKDAFPPELLSKNSGSIIDGFYAWLQGKSESPQFSVDLTQAKQQLATGVADYAKQRYEGLPPCTIQQLQAIDPNNVDAFEVNCRVPGLASDTVYQRVLGEIQNSDGFLQDTTFTADDLPKDEQGRSVTDNLAAAPDLYNLFKSLPWILGILSVLFGVGVLFLSETKRRGLRSLGITLLGTGIFLLIGSWLIGWAFKQINNTQGDAFQNSLIDALSSLVNTYNGNLLKFVLAYILVGAGILLALWYQNRQTTVSTKRP